VRGISLEVARSIFFTFLGPSGSGKSTLLHIMAGFEALSEGRVYFRGAPDGGQPLGCWGF
jgi:ABC-type Fe3+/spermidine/putrescine transport system ATPase subunit